MLDTNFIDFNSPDSTPSGYEIPSDQGTAQIGYDLRIDLQDFSSFTKVLPLALAEAENEGEDAHLDKICGDRMRLLAKAYSDEKANANQKEMMARIEMIEEELENTSPRYGEAEWKLLESFKKAIDAL